MEFLPPYHHCEQWERSVPVGTKARRQTVLLALAGAQQPEALIGVFGWVDEHLFLNQSGPHWALCPEVSNDLHTKPSLADNGSPPWV